MIPEEFFERPRDEDETTRYNGLHRPVAAALTHACIAHEYFILGYGTQVYEVWSEKKMNLTPRIQLNLERVHRIASDQEMSNIELFSLLTYSAKRILIDSCLQHAAAAFNLESTVLWVGTSPKVFGYNIHNNITANPPSGNVKHPNSYLFDYAFDGFAYECHYYTIEEMFDIDKLLEII